MTTTKEQRDAIRRYLDEPGAPGDGENMFIRRGYVRTLLDDLAALEKEPCSLCGHRMGKAKCGHNDYWTTHYGNCMACQREGLKKQLDEARDERDQWKAKYHYAQEPDAKNRSDMNDVITHWREACQRAEYERDYWQNIASL